MTMKRRWRVRAGQLLFACLALYLAATVVRVWVRKYYVFLPDYVRWTFAASRVAHDGPTHLLFLFVDHFEPGHDLGRAQRWLRRYRSLVARHRDADGRPPQHSWFYPGDQVDEPILSELAQATAAGLGEVELHFHHDYETADMLRPRLAASIAAFRRLGFLQTRDGATHFAFIHGNFGLDNSNGAAMCGVNEELRLLRELGCFGDFSFPSVYNDSQPRFVNAVYAAKDGPEPKSYDRRLPLRFLGDGSADLMIFEGPLIFTPTASIRRLFLDLDDGDVHPARPANSDRVRQWVRANIHVAERPQWVFIKIFTHGASSDADEDAAIGPTFDQTLSYLENTYNDGKNFVLHYVTAREAYNVARAAAEGAAGDPHQYFDWVVQPYVADGRAAIEAAAPRAARAKPAMRP